MLLQNMSSFVIDLVTIKLYTPPDQKDRGSFYMKLHVMTRIALMTALCVVGGLIRIPLGPVPMTLNSFFAALSGLLLGASAGAWSQLLYVLIGLLGLPIFSFGGGPSSVMHPTFGFIIGYGLCAWLCGRLLTGKITFFKVVRAVLAGFAALYCIGVPWLWFVFNYVMNSSMTFGRALSAGCAVFIPGDLLKVVVLAFIISRIHSASAIEAFHKGSGE